MSEEKITDLTEERKKILQARIAIRKTSLTYYHEAFQASGQTLMKASQILREEAEVPWKESQQLIKTLRDLRAQTAAAIEHLKNLPTDTAAYYSMMNSLYYLDGEKTAKLILNVDLFQSFSKFNESLTQARKRIDIHVELERQIKEESKEVQELITKIEILLQE